MNLFKLSLCACGLVVAAASVQSTPLKRTDVPAEPIWVLHVDCDGMRPTAIGQFLLAEMDKPEAQAKFAAFQTIFNFDPRKQLHGLTLYSTGKAPEDGVLLVYADFDPERLVTMAKAAKDYQSTTYKQHVIQNWIDDKKKARNGVRPRVYAAIQGGRIVVFAQQEARVAQALDVLDQNAPNLAGSTLFAGLGTGDTTSYIQAAGRKMDIPDSAPNAAMLRLAKMARFQVGEAKGQVRAMLNLEADTEEVAQQMVSVGQGLLALMKLQQNNPGSVKLAEALSLKQDGAGVTASLAIPTADVIELMKADAARKAAQKKAKGEND
ncbi:MAG: hypothetical protein NT154_09525 [Verrucomicrobia bacterium]|nr:hypothetical protein [Verrucomicrobiota bacterium]